MGEMKESVEIKQVHDNDKYIITRKVVEEVNGEQLVKIFGDLTNALAENQKQLNELQGQYETRQKFLEEQVKVLKERTDTFETYAKKIKELAPKEKEEPSKAA